MLHQRMYQLALITVFIALGWILSPAEVTGEVYHQEQFIQETSKAIVYSNKLVNDFQNKLNTFTTQEIYKTFTPKQKQQILGPPISLKADEDKQTLDLLKQCEKVIRVAGKDFTNLSSLCLRLRLDKLFKEFSDELDKTSAAPSDKAFIRSQVKESNQYTIEFYSQMFSANLMHKQYQQIKEELEKSNDFLFDTFYEVRNYPLVLPNATTTQCT